MSDNRTKEDKLDDAILNIAIFIKALFALLVVQSLKGLYWFIRRYPKPNIAVLLGVCASLIAYKIFTGQLGSPAWTFVLIALVLAFSATIVAMIPAGKRDPGVEFAPLK